MSGHNAIMLIDLDSQIDNHGQPQFLSCLTHQIAGDVSLIHDLVIFWIAITEFVLDQLLVVALHHYFGLLS